MCASYGIRRYFWQSATAGSLCCGSTAGRAHGPCLVGGREAGASCAMFFTSRPSPCDHFADVCDGSEKEKEAVKNAVRAAKKGRARVLKLDHSNLVHLPSSVGTLAKVESMMLGDNRIGSLPADIGRLCKNLRQLHISTNALTSIPVEVGVLTRLLALDLSSNALEALPDSLCNLRVLQTLVLHENKLTALPHAFGSLAELRILTLNSN